MLKATQMSPRAAAQAPFDASEIDHFVAEQMATHNIPGLALAITRSDIVIYTKAMAVRRRTAGDTTNTVLYRFVKQIFYGARDHAVNGSWKDRP